MSYRLIGLLFFSLLSATIFAAKFSPPLSGLHVNETATTVALRKEGTIVRLAIENRDSAAMPARIKVELIDPHDKIHAVATSESSIPPGSTILPMPLVKVGRDNDDRRELIWDRLRYRIESTDRSTARPAEVSGIISISKVIPGAFRLQVSAPEEAGSDARYTIRARTLHLVTGNPMSGVKARALMTYEEGNETRKLSATGVTSSTGEALLEFKLPNPLKAESAEIEVVAEREDFFEEASKEVDFLYLNRVLVSADKPLYQPGQTLHIRILGFDHDLKAWAGRDGILKIRDFEGNDLFRAEFKTSRFGVASVDWPIPDNARLGEYRIEVWLGEEGPRNTPGIEFFKIGRYDLPNFVVNVKPDRGYYLPGENAAVEVRADYLFGQPVKRGRVRVVHEAERRWNFREQKWETEEGDQSEGELDGNGVFTARIDLGQKHKEFEPGWYARFRDLRYAAYLTDLTTGRTEARRFDLRITKDPIHIYLVERGLAGGGMPLQFYVSTSYADGSPAPCEVAISSLFDDDTEPGHSPRNSAGDSSRLLLTVKTNRYGVAKVSSLDQGIIESHRKIRLRLAARDDQGRSGQYVHEYWQSSHTICHVETDKALYRAGEPIKARVIANVPGTRWIVDLMRGSRLLSTQVAQLNDGTAEITSPFNQEFNDELAVVAYPAAGDNDGYAYSTGIAKVLYPRNRELKVDVKFNQTAYRPGDEARAELRVLTPQGRAIESALGVVIFDKAVEERVRTDQEFGGRSFGFRDLPGTNESIAGVTRRDLDRLNLSKPLPEGLELVAELLLNQNPYNYRRSHVFSSDSLITDAEETFKSLISGQLKPIQSALQAQYQSKWIYPADETIWRRLMLLAGVEPGDLRDPWGVPYKTRFSIEQANDVFELISAGPDKRFETGDDFTVLRNSWPYFRHTGEAIARAAENYHARTGTFIRDRETLKRELLRAAIDLDLLRDRWGHQYQIAFGVAGRNFSITVRSSGPNGQFEDQSKADGRQVDDFTVSTCLLDYAVEVGVMINRALTASFNATGSVPQNEGDLRQALKQAGIDFDEMRDGWGNRFYLSFKTTSRYTDRVTQFDQARFGETPKPKTEIIPVTQQLAHVIVRSCGADGKEATPDDFDVTEFSRIIAEESAKGLAEKLAERTRPQTISYSGGGGAIAGTVVDPNGAIIPNVTVTAKHIQGAWVWTARTNNEGSYLLSGLAPGLYEVHFNAPGFQSTVFTNVAVYTSNLTRVTVALNVGTVSETVQVTAGSEQSNTSSASVSTSHSAAPNSVTNPQQPLTTPRLREYFPETLFWQPQLETDKQGRAQLRVKLADNITTWKLSVVGSTVNGEMGIAEKEFTAFQPFFAEHDPPRVLTEGDEIALPVVFRNYLNRIQTVSAESKPESWFALPPPARQSVAVKPGDAGQVIFNFSAAASVKDGKQRVTAFGTDASDAIEKPVSVHPDGQEMTGTASGVFAEAGALEINLPEDAIKGSAHAELKIYPNLLAHALEGIEGILQRPYGCGEQTISSTYPNLMILHYLKSRGDNLSVPLQKVIAPANRYLREGYERLLGYSVETGGFSYWGRGNADLALTAYALRFLNDSSAFIKVDEEILEDTRKFIIRQQQSDGRWLAHSWDKENARQTAINTAFIARVLAIDKKTISGDQVSGTAVRRALDYLGKQIEEIDEPYLIASYVLAARAVGEKAGAEKAAAKLRTLAREELGTTYWNLESNTPFHGWGRAGRIETTALAVNALKKMGDRGHSESLVDRGLLFLLRNKDRYGVWLSTQATINVLDTLISLNEEDVAKSASAGTAKILMNGRLVTSIAMPPGGQLTNPITVDLSPSLSHGNNRIEIRRAGGATQASAQIVATYYEPWNQGAEQREDLKLRNSSVLRFAVRYDKTTAEIGEEITCQVAAERVGHQGYGMMLAEIGLPPGADVDRESLERAATESKWIINHYDVLPDRVIVYLWPAAGGVKFDFKLRARYGIRAKAAPSVLYDYYNPEAQAVIAPARFVIK